MQVLILERKYYNHQGEAVTEWLPHTCTNWPVDEDYKPYKEWLGVGIIDCAPYTYAQGRAAYRCEYRMQTYERMQQPAQPSEQKAGSK